MSGFRVDARDAIEASEDLVKDIERFHAGAERRVRRAVEQERSGHRFTNRTGDAERSMKVRAQQSSDGLAMTIEMGVEYASYLERDNWTTFDERVDKALSDIAVAAATLSRKSR